MIFQQFFEILTDPFFWIITVIFFAIGFTVYRYFVVGDMGYNEENAYLDTHLQHYGFQYLGSERQNTFEDNSAQYSVKAARKEDGKEVVFMARIEYTDSVITAVQWEPSFEEV